MLGFTRCYFEAHMRDVDICMTAWPNHPRRLEYFEKCLESLQHLSSGNLHLHCSSETESDERYDVDALNKQFFSLCDRFGVKWRWRVAPVADLGGNMNDALRLGQSPHILFVQDDFQLKNPPLDFFIKTLLRSYGGVFETYVKIREEELAFRVKILPEKVNEFLNFLLK